MIRPFGGVTAIGAASQPVFGTTLTAATIIGKDPYTGTNRPGTQTPPVAVAVASTVGLNVGDRVAVGPKANFTAANRLSLDHGTIAAISSAVAMTVQGLTQVHASGEYCLLNEVASYVQVTPVSAAAPMYLGTDSTVAVADTSVFDVIAAPSSTTAEPVYWHVSPTTGLGDSYDTSQYWIQGTSGATFIARFHQN